MKQAKSNVFIGVDVSKNSLDVAVGPSGETIGFANSEDGIALLADFIKPLAPTLVLFEATGGGEMNAVRHLAAQRLPLVVLNPRRSGTSPRPPDSLPRPMPSISASWPVSAKPSDPRCGP